MNLYSITRTDEIGYDEMRACVVRAGSIPMAQAIAATHAQDEDSSVWLNGLVTVTHLGTARDEEAAKGAGLVLADIKNA